MSILRKNIFYKSLFFVVLLMLLFSSSLGKRVIRIAGDDKVYVSQSLEMAQEGSWFFQRLQNEPNYMKGPIHYILLRIGHLVLDRSMWATTYMNLIFLFLALVFLSKLGALSSKNTAAFLELPFIFLSLLSVFLYLYASQMESALACLYAMSLYFIYKSSVPSTSHPKYEYSFWFLAGVCGLFKSPLHSVLIGLSLILFWIYKGIFIQKIKSIHSWLAWVLGVVICASLYLPILLFDYWPFWHSYIGRETLWKAPNGSQWYEPVVPLFTYFIFPWTIVFFASIIDLFLRAKKKKIFLEPSFESDLFILGCVLLLPSIFFFSYFQYRVNTYLIPVVSGVMLIFYSLFKTTQSLKLYRSAALITAGVLGCVSVLYLGVLFYLSPLPEWFSYLQGGSCAVGFFVLMYGFLKVGLKKKGEFLTHSFFVSLFIFYFGLSQLMVNFGEREMVDIKNFISKNRLSPSEHPFQYVNMNQGIWSEWGYLNFWIQYPVVALYKWSEIEAAFLEKKPFILASDRDFNEFQVKIEEVKKTSKMTFEVSKWKRWKTQGKTEDGKTRWLQVLFTKDFSWIEKEYYLILPVTLHQ